MEEVGEIKVNIGKIVKIGQKRKSWLELVDVTFLLSCPSPPPGLWFIRTRA
jgi:hypothetical protein